MDSLGEVTRSAFTGCSNIAEMANEEGGWSPDTYALSLAEHIRDSRVPLDRQRERLAALAQVGQGLAGDQSTAEELARHYVVLEALFHRFARIAHELPDDRPHRVSAASEKYLNMALKAQRGALATLSAIKVVRDGNQPPATSASEMPTHSTLPAVPASEAGSAGEAT